MLQTQKKYQNLVKGAAIAASLFSLCFILIKFYAWYISSSASILASLSDSSLDAFASTINLFAIYYALKPADEEHKFGHGKIESIAALFQGIIIAVSAILLLFYTLEKFKNPQIPKQINLSIYLMIIISFFTTILVLWQNYVVKKTNSLAIKADSLHYKTDLLINISIIVALILSSFELVYIDAIFSFFIACYILKSCKEIIQKAIDTLLDKEIDKTQLDKIKNVLNKNKKILGYHELKTRNSGTDIFIQVHIELNDNITLIKAHEIADEIENSLAQEIKRSITTIHMDPISVVTKEITKRTI